MLKVSSEKVVAEHQISATTMSIDDNQSIISLAGKQGIYLINVDQPNDVVCSISRNSKYDAIASDFHPRRRIYYALSSNNNVEIYSFEQFKNKSLNSYNYHSYNNGHKKSGYDETDELFQENGDRSAALILRAHTRTITDLNWCPFSYDLLATCSIDTFINIWDIREPKKPNLSLTSVAGANQVKWNKIDENLIATSHEVDARIWDIRKGNNPLHYIAAHLQKIYGLDWHPSISTELATCSQDNTVKFWNLQVIKNKAESYINTNNRPVWRAKYTPLANGLITSQIKQNLDNSLWLWNTNNLDKPVYSFVTPQDLVVDFHFRTNRSQIGNLNENLNETGNYYKTKYNDLRQEYTNFDHDLELENDENLNTANLSTGSKKPPHFTFEIVSWSKDNKLRIWNLDESLSVIDCDVGQLVKYTNRYLQGNFRRKSIIGGDYIKSLLNNEKKKMETIYNPSEPNEKNGIAINYSSSNPFSRMSEKYSSSNTDLKELGQTSLANKKTRKSSMAIPKTSPTDLKQEFSFIDTSNLKNLKIEEMNAMKRYCVIQAKSMYNNFVYRLKIAFPINYPNNIPPNFYFLDSNTRQFDLTSLRSLTISERGTSKSKTTGGEVASSTKSSSDFDQPKLSQKDQKLYQETKVLLLNTLQNTAHMQVKRNRPCLEPCLKEFMAQIDEQPNTININVNDTLYSSFHDAFVPFPKTCGARFSGPNLLICFSRALATKLATTTEIKPNVAPTPKALSALSHYLNSPVQKKLNVSNASASQGNLNRNAEALPTIFPISVSSFYTANRIASTGKVRHKSAKNKSARNSNWFNLPLYIYNVEKILPCSKYLAENYINPVKMCTHNAEVAAKAGKKDHLNCWQICKLIADPVLNQTDDTSLMEFPWSKHPFCGSLIESYIDYYLSVLDIQMAAMLACCFASACSNCKRFACSGRDCQKISQITNVEMEKKPNRQSSLPMKNSFYRAKLNKIFKTNSSPYHTIGASTIAVADQNKGNHFFDRSNFGYLKDQKDLQTQLKSYDIIKRVRSNSWSDIAETNGSLSDLTVIDSTCSVYGSANSPNHNNFRSIGGGSFVNNVFNLDRCECCQPAIEDRKEHVDNRLEQVKCTSDELAKRDNDLRILNPNRQFQFDCLKQSYADLLYCWRLLEQRCSVLNYVRIENNYQKVSQYTFDYSNYCPTCKELIRNNSQCRNCRRVVVECSICHISVKGLVSSCLLCGHGYHLEHAVLWFAENKVCPTGCGCHCEFDHEGSLDRRLKN